MSAVDVKDRLGDGLAALLVGDWETARRTLEEVAAVSDDPV